MKATEQMELESAQQIILTLAENDPDFPSFDTAAVEPVHNDDSPPLDILEEVTAVLEDDQQVAPVRLLEVQPLGNHTHAREKDHHRLDLLLREILLEFLCNEPK